MKPTIPRLVGLASLLFLCRIAAPGAPFAEKVPFTQPDGTQIVLWGQGDEFYAVFETLDGYTVVFNQQTRGYEYAQLSADGEQLVGIGVAVGRGDPAALGLKPHLRINSKAVRKQAAARFARWDQGMEITRRWSDLKSRQRLAELAAAKDGDAKSPPSWTTTGQKLGLTLLIDFSDAVGTIPQAEVINYCNGDSYTGYGNNGSVKQYYLDNSANLLTYSNVVTIYIRAPQPKTYYNNTANDCGIQGRLLITDAIAAMKALANYTTDILPTFSNLTVDGSSRVAACNVFFAGANSGVWSYGLWPHSWVLASSIDLGNGKRVYRYQITNLGTGLTLGTFCHENGHMLCGFPDLYDYDYDSTGGAGNFCLMSSGSFNYNPAQVCAYLKRAAGWATTIPLTSSSVLTASVSSSGTNFNNFYRYAKPGVSTEYFLVENRQKSGRDANLPASGIAIWHIDELGDRDNQSTNLNTSHLNYEASLMQADNLWHFQNNVNSGDSRDLYYLGNTAGGYSNWFSDSTSPSARWWDGSPSGINFHHFSASGTTMTFGVGPEGPVIAADNALVKLEGCTPANGVADPNETVSVDFALKNSGGRNTTNLVATLLATNGVTSPSGPQAYGVLVTNAAAVARPFTFTATGACGGNNTATLHLEDSGTNLGTVTFSFPLGQSSISTNLHQDFDAVTPPALPANWTTSASNAQSGWVTTTAASDTAPNSVFSPDPDDVGVNELNSPTITLPVSPAQVSFQHSYQLESGYDGGVLEIKIGTESWADILTAGGNFVSGGYTRTLSSSYNNPLSGRSAWTGNSGGFIATLINLPPAAAGQSIQLRWRCGSDSGVSGAGWHVDTLSVTILSYACCTASADLEAALTASPNPVVRGQPLTYTLTVTNLGPAPAVNVTLTNTLPAGVTFVSASPGCVSLGETVIASVGPMPGGSATNFTLVVTPSVGGPNTNTLAAASLTFDPNPSNNSTTNVITVNAPPVVTGQPSDQTVIAGTNVILQVIALGTEPLAYEWFHNGTNLAGAVDCVVTLTNVGAAQAGTYTVIVTNEFGSALSSNAVLTVRDPWIVGQPTNQTVSVGAPATFTVSEAGTPPMHYQWLKGGIPLVDGANISGALTPALTVAQVAAGDMGYYSLAVSNLYGQVISSNATLVANLPPVILTQPASQTALAGATVLFTTAVVGPGPMGFQWRRAGTNLADGGKISGSATASLTVSNVQSSEIGEYRLVVTNAYGSVTSSNALLTLWPLVVWGRNDYAAANVPGGLSNVLAVAGGLYHCLALRADGTVAAWGAGTTNTGVNPQRGQAIVPDGLSNVVALAAGAYHSLALESNGTLAAWGAGTTNTGISPHFGQAMVPDGLSDVAMTSGGGFHTLALKRDGSLTAWGAGTTNSGLTPHYGQASVPGGLSNMVAIAAGSYHSLALKCDGTVVGWGAGLTNAGVNPQYGQANIPNGLSNVVMLAAGGNHSLALRADGTVAGWGDNTYGQINPPADLSNVVAIAAGRYYSLALTSDGTMLGWGDNTYAQTNLPAGLTNVAATAAGGYHPLALASDGRPHVTVHPFSQTVIEGCEVRLVGLAVGLPPLSYQWQFNGTNLAEATSTTLTLSDFQCPDAGSYTMIVSNLLGSAASLAAVLTTGETSPPTISCPADVAVNADAGTCAATNVALGSPVTGDNCGIAGVTNDQQSSYPLGTNLVTWTVTDTSGNTNSCQQRVVVLDAEAPTISWHVTNVIVAADTNCQALMPDITGTNYILTTDNCGSVTVTQSVATDTVLGLGTNQVVLGAFDPAGNAAYCTSFVLVLDQAPPSIECPADLGTTNQPSQCGAVVHYTAPASRDDCSEVMITQLAGLPSGSLFPAGKTTNTFQATDATGNSAADSFVVTVDDAEPPVISWCLTNVALTAGTNCQALMPDITGTNYILTTDNCGSVTVTQSVATDTVLGLGTNEVVLGAFDPAGNTAYCTNYVLVADDTPPAITWHLTNVIVAAGTNCQALMPDITGTNYILTTDNCGSVTVTQSVATDTVLALGTNEVVLGAFDPAGNAAYCTSFVLVLDQAPPSIECPADLGTTNQPSQCGAVVHYTAPASRDDCSEVMITQLAGLPSGSLFPAGKTTNTFQATDATGNSAADSFVVTVDDAEPPVISWCLTNVALTAGTNCQALMPDITGTNYILTTDNCGSVTVTQSVATDAVLSLGTNEVVLGAFDPAGNTAYCTNYVLVADDTPPTVICPASITVGADAGQCSRSNVTWEVAASDNCAVTNLVSEPPSGATFPVGVTPVRCTATDASGNTNSCSFTVTVIVPTVILAPPSSLTVVRGEDAFFGVTATNDCASPLTYQWRFNGGQLAGATDSTYMCTNTQCADAGSFDVVVASLDGSQTSSIANLTVVAPPVILEGPVSEAVPLGQSAILCISATNNCGGQLAYQWRFQGVNIPGATTDCYTLATVRPANVGNYDLVVTNLAAAVTSPVAVLTVVGPRLTVSRGEPSQPGGAITNFLLVFPSVTGIDYVVQYVDTLTNTNNWLSLVTNPGTGGLVTNDFPITAIPPSRFYRILIP